MKWFIGVMLAAALSLSGATVCKDTLGNAPRDLRGLPMGWRHYDTVIQGSSGTRQIMNVQGRPAVVLKDEGGVPALTKHPFGKGTGVYMGGYRHSVENAGELLRLILSLTGCEGEKYITDNVKTECAYYPNDKKLVIINNAETEEAASVMTDGGKVSVKLAPYDIAIIEL